MHSYRGFLLIFLSGIIGIATLFFASETTHAQQQAQKVVEEVQIIGRRRLRQEDILYYVQTRAGDPFNEQQIQRDLQTLLSLGFFDKVKSRVYTEEGPRGGVVVIFQVSELPIIRDIQFEGLNSLAESDMLKTFRETPRRRFQREHLRSGKGTRGRACSQRITCRTRSSQCHR